MLNQSPRVAVAEGVRTPDDETPTEEESEFDLNLWFLWEFPRTLPSGAKRKSFFGLVHRTIGPDGRLVSWSILNYWSGPDYQVLFPLFYRTGPEGEKHLGIIPLYFQGPDYWVTPFALSAGWRDEGDISHNWITPLFHISLDEGGALHSLHLGPYVQGRYYQVLFPLFYRTGPERGKHLGIIPLYFQGPD